MAKLQPTTARDESSSLDPRKVWVVHGRNLAARDVLFDFLRAINLVPLEWEEALSRTRGGSPYIGEVLDLAFDEAKAFIVLLTGDDLGRLDPRFTRDTDPTDDHELTPQVRQNVAFEAGWAIGKDSKRTILVSLGRYRRFSNIEGRHVLRLSNNAESRQALASRLKAIGCQVLTDGRTDWLSKGDFDSAVATELTVPDKVPSKDRKVRLLDCFVFGFGLGKATWFLAVSNAEHNNLMVEAFERFGLDPSEINRFKDAMKQHEPATRDYVARLNTLESISTQMQISLGSLGSDWFSFGYQIALLALYRSLPGYDISDQVARIEHLIERLNIKPAEKLGKAVRALVLFKATPNNSEKAGLVVEKIAQLAVQRLT
jgi:predicted nucleotide-binding protein